MTYGLDWSLERGNIAIATTVGQSYRFGALRDLFPEGTGLTGRVSDIVGRTRVRYGRFIDITHRYRIDKNNLGPSLGVAWRTRSATRRSRGRAPACSTIA